MKMYDELIMIRQKVTFLTSGVKSNCEYIIVINEEEIPTESLAVLVDMVKNTAT